MKYSLVLVMCLIDTEEKLVIFAALLCIVLAVPLIVYANW